MDSEVFVDQTGLQFLVKMILKQLIEHLNLLAETHGEEIPVYLRGKRSDAIHDVEELTIEEISIVDEESEFSLPDEETVIMLVAKYSILGYSGIKVS